MPLKVGILGHSIVRDLGSLGNLFGRIEGDSYYELRFFSIPGSCFSTWLRWPEQLHSVFDFEPEVLFVVLGSNSLKDSESVRDIARSANIFLEILRNNLDSSKLVLCQVENRYLSIANRHGTPPHHILLHWKTRKPQVLLAFGLIP